MSFLLLIDNFLNICWIIEGTSAKDIVSLHERKWTNYIFKGKRKLPFHVVNHHSSS